MQPGPAPQGLSSWDVAECGKCHVDVVAQWRESGHASARSHHVFQAALREESPVWCVRCHAPLSATNGQTVTTEPKERGVTCAACHVHKGQVVGSRNFDNDMHRVAADPAYLSGELCAGCHQFGFAIRDATGRVLRLSEDAQQNTFVEWQAWRTQTKDPRTCVDCHMRPFGHSFGGKRRYDDLRTALEAHVEQDRIGLLLRRDEIGHAMPTGDVMRWLSLEIAADPLFETVTTIRRFLRRVDFRHWPGESEARVGLVAEDTLLPGRVAWTALPPTTGARYWRVVYHLVAEAQEQREIIPAGTSEIVLFAGELRRKP